MPTILLAQEDADSRASFSALILDFFPTAVVRALDSWEELESVVSTPPAASVLLADILWGEEDRSGELLLLSESCPEVSFGVFSRYDLSGSLPAGYPIPLLAPDEQLPLRLAEIMENFSGREIGPYSISGPAGPHPLGRLYWAKHHQLERSVQLLVPPSGSPVFPKAIRAMARVNHPSVYALYESVPWENRILVAQEPILNPSLLHLRMSDKKPGLLPCARLATALGSVLAEMESSSVPARLLGDYDYTLSTKETPRLRNPAAYPGQTETSAYHNAQHLAGILEPFLQSHPKGTQLIEILRNPGTSAYDLLRKTKEFERQLADVRQVHVRQEELEAAEKTLRARKIRQWAILAGCFAVLAYLAVFAQTFFRNILMDAPSRVPEADLPVPAGTVTLGSETREVPSFFMDRHEVTIGEYEKFLAAIERDPNWSRWVPEQRRALKKSVADFAPIGWGEILRAARKNGSYSGQKISRDTPVFNVDYVSAVTYAKWKNGRRLPKKEEWLLAASGPRHLRYPWGNEADNPKINLGSNASPKQLKDPAYFRVLPAESNPGDVGPFGHMDLGGNLSEWISSPPSQSTDGASVRFIGGNWLDEVPVSNEDAVRLVPLGQSDPRIGFRTVR